MNYIPSAALVAALILTVLLVALAVGLALLVVILRIILLIVSLILIVLIVHAYSPPCVVCADSLPRFSRNMQKKICQSGQCH